MLLLRLFAIVMILPTPVYRFTGPTMTEQYSTVQKLSLAGMVVGGILCLVGAASPYWIVSDPQGFSFVGQLIGKVVKAFVGLYMFCIEAVGEKECTILKIDGHSSECSLSFLFLFIVTASCRNVNMHAGLSF